VPELYIYISPGCVYIYIRGCGFIYIYNAIAFIMLIQI